MNCPEKYCNWKFHVFIISIIVIFAVGNHHFTQTDFDEKAVYVNMSLIVSGGITIAILAVITKRYHGDKIVRMSFLFLLFSYIAYLFGEVAWFVFETILGIYPYPSVADVGYLNYFILSVIFVITITRRYATIGIHDVGYVILIISIITTTYLFISLGEESEMYLVILGMPFVLSCSAMFAFSLVALYKLRHTSIGTVWIILFMSMTVTTVADIWYYTAENLGQYTYSHIMNTMWIVSDALLIYALLLYRKVL